MVARLGERSRKWHETHPGYFAERMRIYRERMGPNKRRRFAEKYNRGRRLYVRVYVLFRRALNGSRTRRLTAQERLVVKKYTSLRKMAARGREPYGLYREPPHE